MQVDYLHRPSVSLDNLNDEELAEATKKHILDMIPEVVHAEIWRDAKPRTAEWAEAGNRHERRRAAALERKKK
jgi:hypothetical protein